MAIYIVEGKIGSGKTYYCVHSILKKYFQYDELLDEYIPVKPLLILSNIDGLKIDHINITKEIENHSLQTVFSEAYVNQLRDINKLRTIIYLIDEAQSPTFFPRKFYDPDVFFFFQYSRHYGIDIYLVTQDVESLAKELRTLSEYYIHAVSRTHGTGVSFRYKFISNDEVFRSAVVKRDRKIFRAYTSFNVSEAEPPRPVYIRYIGYFIVFVVIAVFLFKFVFLGAFGKSRVTSLSSLKGQAQESKKKSDIKSIPYENLKKVHEFPGSSSRQSVALKSASFSSEPDVKSFPPQSALPSPAPLPSPAVVTLSYQDMKNYEKASSLCDYAHDIQYSVHLPDKLTQAVFESFICRLKDRFYEVRFRDKVFDSLIPVNTPAVPLSSSQGPSKQSP